MNCKPGDLAVVVSDGQGGASNAIGMIVEIIEPAMCHSGIGWICRLPSVRTISGEGRTLRSDKFKAPDAWLRPVSGLPITDDIKDEVTA